MTLREQIFELFNEIENNENRLDGTFDENVKTIKHLLKGKLNSEQTTVFLNWCNNICPKFRNSYRTDIAGFFDIEQFQNTILLLVYEIENNNHS